MRLSRRACRASPLEVASTRVWRMQSSRRAGSASQVAIMSTRVWRMRRSRWACSASQLFSASISLDNVSDYDFNPRWDCLQEHLRKLPLRGRNLGFAFGLPGPPKRNPFLLGRPLFCRFRRRLASFSMLILYQRHGCRPLFSLPVRRLYRLWASEGVCPIGQVPWWSLCMGSLVWPLVPHW